MAKSKKRVVIKIGTSSLTGDSASGQRGSGLLEALAEEVSALAAQGFEFILVTSGAIGAGIQEIGWSKRPDEIAKKQAAAAIGQVTLMQTYQRLFKEHNRLVAQVLLTRSDFEDRKRYLNARNTLSALLELGVVPIINENDTVAVEEIQFGDNDRLSALVAAKIDADLLIILSNVDGLIGRDGEVVPLVPQITADVEKLAWSGVKSEMGTGGMTSKIEAAKIATASGVTLLIANAARRNIVRDALDGKSVGTRFVPMRSLSARDRWIVFGAVPKGEIIVDEGAAHALRQMNRSLLAAGILRTSGNFKKGDVVKIKSHDDQELGRGIACFSRDEVESIKGLKTSEIRKVLSHAASTEVVHRDQLVLLP